MHSATPDLHFHERLSALTLPSTLASGEPQAPSSPARRKLVVRASATCQPDLSPRSSSCTSARAPPGCRQTSAPLWSPAASGPVLWEPPQALLRRAPERSSQRYVQTRVKGDSMRGHIRKRGNASFEYIVDVGTAPAQRCEVCNKRFWLERKPKEPARPVAAGCARPRSAAAPPRPALPAVTRLRRRWPR